MKAGLAGFVIGRAIKKGMGMKKEIRNKIVRSFRKIYRMSNHHSTKDLVFTTSQNFKQCYHLLSVHKLSIIDSMLESMMDSTSPDGIIRSTMAKIIMMCKSEQKEFLNISDSDQGRVAKLRNIIHNLQEIANESDSKLFKMKCYQTATKIQSNIHKFTNKNVEMLYNISKKKELDIHDIVEMMTIVNLAKRNSNYGNSPISDKFNRGKNNLFRKIFTPISSPHKINY